MHKHIVNAIVPGSIAEELGIFLGDELVSMNKKVIEDVLEYAFLEKDEEIELIMFRPSTNEDWEFFIEKDEAEKIGLQFNNRVLFLQGNYTTLSHIIEKDFQRIMDYRLSPMNLSIHTMNMELRSEMLHNPLANRLISFMDRMYEANIVMNGQIALCKGINDGNELDDTLQKLLKYHPHLQSVSILPVVLTKYQDDIQTLKSFTQDDAKNIISLVSTYQEKMFKETGDYFVYAGDDFYSLAGEEVPSANYYDGYLQYDNGVGMTRLLIDEFNQCYNELKNKKFDFQNIKYNSVSLITGPLIAPVIRDLREQLNALPYNAPEVIIHSIPNGIFGPQMTVSGLVTGKDIINHLKDSVLGDIIYIPDNMLKHDEPIFLDDVTLKQVEEALKRRVIPLSLKGNQLFDAILGKEIQDE